MMIGIKKQSRAVFVACHTILRHICCQSVLRRIHRPSHFFMVHSLSVMLLQT
jgi:hypothetical protein